MIYCIWYPSGGYGHFINGIISLHGKDFVRPKKEFGFSTDGNSHSLDLAAPTYFKDPTNYDFNFDQKSNYGVLIDNGISNEGTRFRDFFPDSRIIKICYKDYDWPILANTMIHKAMKTNFNSEVSLDSDNWSVSDPWAVREKYFLFLRDHYFRQWWKPSDDVFPVMVKDLLTYQSTKKAIENIGIVLSDFEDLWNQWWHLNKKYFDPVIKAECIINGSWPDQPVTDTWEQAVTYFEIWRRYGVEVPHNDFPDFFYDRSHLDQWLEKVL